MRRRRLLELGVGLGAGTVAGCTDTRPGTDGDVSPTATPESTPAGGTATEPTVSATSTDSRAADLDLREANVTGVTLEPRGDDSRVSVTLIHDDDGEAGYANWWQVESLDGQRLGRRDLAHPHGTREFTRSATVSIPESVACVVVRGHDETHGYGGQAALVAVDAGRTRLVGQGSEPARFDPTDCP